MFSNNSNDEPGKAQKRRRGRPPGRTPHGNANREEIFQACIRSISEKGYEATTLRGIGKELGLSAALLYLYFPSKSAVVLELYARLGNEVAEKAMKISQGKWRERFIETLSISLSALKPHRSAIRALSSVLLGDPDEGVFAKGNTAARERVENVFIEAVTGASDVPGNKEENIALGRLLYLIHLAVLMWWMLDRSEKQNATGKLIDLFHNKVLGPAALAMKLPATRKMVQTVTSLYRQALLGER